MPGPRGQVQRPLPLPGFAPWALLVWFLGSKETSRGEVGAEGPDQGEDTPPLQSFTRISPRMEPTSAKQSREARLPASQKWAGGQVQGQSPFQPGQRPGCRQGVGSLLEPQGSLSLLPGQPAEQPDFLAPAQALPMQSQPRGSG